jgi:hypothetical protein
VDSHLDFSSNGRGILHTTKLHSILSGNGIMSFNDGGADKSDVSLARSRTTDVVDSSIVKTVKEIDGLLEEMRELSLLQGASRMRMDDSQSEMSSDVNGHDSDMDLALELNLADESFRKNHRSHPGNLQPSNAYFQRQESQDDDDSPIALSMGEQLSSAMTCSWPRNVQQMKAKAEMSLEVHDKSVRRTKSTRLLKTGLFLILLGALIVLITALLVVKKENDPSSSSPSSSVASQFNIAAPESNNEVFPDMATKTEAIPTSGPTSSPTTLSPTATPTDRPTRSPSTAPVVSSTELPTIANLSSSGFDKYEGDHMDGYEDDGYYYHEKENSKRGKGSGKVLKYHDWE